jgi:hypothetical protein
MAKFNPLYQVLNQDEIDSLLGFDDEQYNRPKTEIKLLEKSPHAQNLYYKTIEQEKQYIELIEELGDIGDVYHEMLVLREELSKKLKEFEDLKSEASDETVNKLEQMSKLIQDNKNTTKQYELFYQLHYDAEDKNKLPTHSVLMDLEIHYIKEKIRRLIQERKNEE